MKAILIPAGPANLNTLFAGINWHDVEEYSLNLRDAGDVTIATTPTYRITFCDENVRLFFMSYAGTLDAIDFELVNMIHETKSDNYEKITATEKDVHAIGRSNVKSNDIYQVRSNKYEETAKDWIDELLDSPLAFIYQAGLQGQPDSYLPIVIMDDKRAKITEEDRWMYEINLQFKLSHEKVTVRN